METINLSGFNSSSIVDGPGLRFTIYTQGCAHKCKGCHNPKTWNNKPNQVYTHDSIINLIEENSINRNVTISGGDPLYQLDSVLSLCKKLKELNYNIWLYTGYTYEEIEADKNLRKILNFIDVLVDGKFEQDKKDFNLNYKGSSNQRIIDIAKIKKED